MPFTQIPRHAITLLLFFITVVICRSSIAEEQIGELSWHTDYSTAYRQAAAEHKLLFLYFRGSVQQRAANAFENAVLSDEEIQDSLEQYVRVVLPVDVSLATMSDEALAERLLDHVAFKHMEHRQGIAVMDLMDDETGQYGKLISAHPFTPGKYYSRRALQIVLELPRASVTQRALIYAIRIHPESPKSTDCEVDEHLLTETQKHSRVMARIEQVGHHDWNRRFQELTAKYGELDVNEVAAVSWGGESLIEGAKDCVHAWRQSPGHWKGVSGAHVFYGYDLVLGASGKWYATGLFATRR